MAIVKMDKLSIVGLEAQKSDIIKLIMDRGFVQIDDGGYLTEEEGIGEFLKRDSQEAEVAEFDQKLYLTELAIGGVKLHLKEKKPMFSAKREYAKPSEAQESSNFSKVTQINALLKKFSELNSMENNTLNSKSILLPWIKFDVPISRMETKTAKAALGTLPILANLQDIEKKFEDAGTEALIRALDSDKMFTYAYVISHKSAYDAAMEILKEYGFTPVSLSDIEGTPEEGVKNYDKTVEEIRRERENTIKEIVSYKSGIQELENLFDFYTVERDRKKIVENLVRTRTSFCISGWLPAEKSSALTEDLMKNFDCAVETQAGTREEGFPVLLKNNAFVTPFETVTNMYSCPSVNDIDPNGILAVCFTIFYGMMMADLGYGLILTAGCAFVIHKSKFKKDEGKLFKLMLYCGMSAIVFGFLFGGVFGAEIKIFQIINPLDQIMLLMGISLLMGIAHLFIGMGIKGVKQIRDGDIMGLIADVIAWYITIIGLCLVIVPIVIPGTESFGVIGKKVLIVGAILVVATNGREEKNIIKKFFSGISSLYGISGYFGDILSYTRIMALCLSGGIVAQVMNQLAGMLAHGPAIIGAIGVVLVGHGINLFTGALGAYVHTTRLHYVEFFGKFYDGGGTPFKPFGYKTKYTNINS